MLLTGTDHLMKTVQLLQASNRQDLDVCTLLSGLVSVTDHLEAFKGCVA